MRSIVLLISAAVEVYTVASLEEEYKKKQIRDNCIPNFQGGGGGGCQIAGYPDIGSKIMFYFCVQGIYDDIYISTVSL